MDRLWYVALAVLVLLLAGMLAWFIFFTVAVLYAQGSQGGIILGAVIDIVFLWSW